MKSLQGRILCVLAGSIVLCWASVLTLMVVYIAKGQSSVLDKELEAIGTKIFYSIPSDFGSDAGKLSSRKKIMPPHRQDKRERELMESEHFAFQVWLNRDRLVVRAPGSPATALQPDFSDGFTNTLVEGKRWRVFGISDDTGKVHVQIAARQSLIDEELRHKTFGALSVATVLLLTVGVLMWFALRRSLKPVFGLREAVRRRQRFDLTPLPVVALPTELRPLVESFNYMLEQVNLAVESERRFIGDAAHELRTPLAALQAQTQVALGATTLEGKNAALGKLLAIVERSSRLSDQLLDQARLDAGVHAPQKTLADLSELVMHVSQEFDMQAQQQRRSIILALTHCPIECDVDEIGILLRNLLDNALRYTAEGGRVQVSCSTVHEYGRDQICLEVADDGPGVPATEHEAIFRRFHRVAGNSGRGSGIGLSLVAGIAALHGATIRTGPGLDGRGFSVRVLFAQPAPPQSA